MTPQQSIAHYRIVSKLGEGGMGTVYRATDSKLHRDVAIKVLPDSFAQDGDRVARFSREAQVLAALNHPNIAAIYGIEEGALVMELVEGENLSGPLPLDTALSYAKQITAALEAAHEKGIIHRDLKPANIKVTPDGTVKLLDFGLAKAVEKTVTSPANPTISPTLSLAMTQAGGILGTAAYMSPEQARGKTVDKRTDIWAFGVVLYEMLTGRPLFADETVTDTLAHVLTRAVDLTTVPAAVRPLLARCLERDPKKRLRDIGDAWYLLADAAAVPAPAVEPAPRRPWPWVVSGVFGLLASLFLMLWLRTPATRSLAHRYTVEGTSGFSFSPDGHWLLSSRGGLKLRAHDSMEWRTLPGTEDADYPFWSPDSSTIGFFAAGRLRSISVQGTGLRNLAAAPNPRGGSWHGSVSDGTLLFASDGRLQSFKLDSSQLRALPIQYPAGTRADDPAFLPDSDRFVFLLGNDLGAALYRSSLSAGSEPPRKFLETAHQVTFARHPRTGAWHIFFSQGSFEVDGYTLMTSPIDPRTGDLKGPPVKIMGDLATVARTRLLDFDVADNGMLLWRRSSASLPVWRLRWFDRSGNILSTVGDPGTYMALALSPDETQLAVMQGYPASDIWLYDLRKGTGSRLSTEAGSKMNPLWSPDGRSIYYVLLNEGVTTVVRRASGAGGQPETVSQVFQGVQAVLQDITPDGRYLLLMLNNGVKTGVYRLDQNAPAPRAAEFLIADSPQLRIGGEVRLMPDGHRLLIAQPRGAAVLPYPPGSGNTIQYLTNSVRSPFFSKDGRSVYGTTATTGIVTLFVQSILPGPGGTGIRFGEPANLFTIQPPTRVGTNHGAVSRDGSRILEITAEASEELKMQVLTDWTTLLPGGH